MIAMPNVLNANLMKIGFSKMLRYLSTTADIFTALNGNYNVQKKQIPNAIYYRVDGLDNTSHTHRLPLVMPLAGAPRYGNVQFQPGFEENIQTKEGTIFKNDYSHAVVMQLFGIDAQDKKYYDLIAERLPLLGTYFKELKGVHIRQAGLERWSENLTLQPPTNALITAQFGQAAEWSPNIYVKNCPENQQPVFDQNLVAHTNNIGNAMMVAGVGVNSTCDFNFLAALANYASYTREIDPLDNEKYIVLIPTRQTYFLKNPLTAGSLGQVFIQQNRTQDKDMNYPNLLGVFQNLILIEDPRAATLTLGGTSEPFTLTANYRYPGRNDQRPNTLGTRDVGQLLGKGAFIDWDAEGLHYETENALTYGKYDGQGGFGTCGVQQAQYDTVNRNAREQFTSIQLIFGRATITP